MDYIHTTKAEPDINLDIPLSKQDPLDKLNDLVNKKRKHANDIHDYFKANKRLKSLVQYEDHLPGTVLNEPVLGLDDHVWTFSSLLLAEIDKRNLNPLKQMRVIKQLSGTETEEGLLKVYKAGKRLLYVKSNKAISLGNATSKVGQKILKSPGGSPIPVGDGDGDVKRFPDGDGDVDGVEKRRWGR
ncbi:hypothetical protein Tco_0385353, partial [Tanacetum coccineum]